MTAEEAIAALDGLNADDAEVAHSIADAILLDTVPPIVRDAYERVTERAPFWATA